MLPAQANEWSPIKPAQCPKDEQGRVDLDDLTDKDLDYGCDLYGLASLRQRLRRATDNYKGSIQAGLVLARALVWLAV